MPKLVINVMTDPPDNARQMQAVFPREVERNSYIYVGDNADDINELDDTEAWDYLMAFKFLGRCK